MIGMIYGQLTTYDVGSKDNRKYKIAHFWRSGQHLINRCNCPKIEALIPRASYAFDNNKNTRNHPFHPQIIIIALNAYIPLLIILLPLLKSQRNHITVVSNYDSSEKTGLQKISERSETTSWGMARTRRIQP